MSGSKLLFYLCLKKVNCDNYRGISLLSPFTKIFEKILSSQIISHFNKNGLFSQVQHGFRANHSCETALQSLLDNWKTLIDQNNLIVSLFIDFKKAFDLLDPHLLFLKLFHYGFDNNSLLLIKNFFSDRQQKVKVNCTSSSFLPILYGVPQGSTLGPLLFLIFINDLSFFLNCTHTLFADDTTIYTSAEILPKAINNLKNTVDALLIWCNHNKMEINWLKTKAMIITSIRRNRSEFPSALDLHNSVEVVEEFKLLGVLLDCKLNFSNHILNLKKSITKKLFIIKNMFHLSAAVRLQFFKSFILPYFDYCLSIFLYFNNKQIDELENLYNFCILKLFNIKLKFLNLSDKYNLLKNMNLFPFKIRLFYRLSLFSYKKVNNLILSEFNILSEKPNYYNLRNTTKSIYIIPKVKTESGKKRLSYLLPLFLNSVLRNSVYLSLKDFKFLICTNLFQFINDFIKIFFPLEHLQI
jgi:hypothetical protein